MERLQFKIEGEFITNTAREAFYSSHNLKRAIDIVKSATECELSEGEHLKLCLDIISGKKSIVGTYPGDDYGVIENETPLCTDILDELNNREERVKTLKEQYDNLTQKFLFITSNLPNYKLRELNSDYTSEYDEKLFDITGTGDVLLSSIVNEPDDTNAASAQQQDVLSDYINHMKSATDDDYGWLEPDGTYHPVPWGEHSEWAKNYADTHYPFRENASMYWRNINGERRHVVCGDFLMYALGWCLLDNPCQGTATPKYDTTRGLSKKQKEFLFDYYIKRNMHDKASALYKDDDDF